MDGGGGDEAGAGDASNPVTTRRPAAPTPLSKKRYKKLDLKSFFPSTNSTSGSNSGPSTRESGNVVVPESEEQEELRDSEPHPVETVQEMDHRFNEVSSELLICFSCLDPRDSFSMFDLEKIARITEIYDQDFSIVDRSNIRDELENNQLLLV
ncbi:unnamed protein product [Miscanthus lutarioriparius]|uniref:Uncharacterized protein n=1 Tax=Miscanthus lutarioriparius TaxID=422564 RepID=A0A811QDI8_9POAL|nr:unnamed protein product [Miscanthus lutarioriparius]